ncbi:MAG: hypothetical protein A3B99_04510 [Candidatus Yanofskybacteria bacterium RIFCSPHIGHO2_02_FULL_44_12b]|uniref:Adenylosuccinate synthetase n=1 Tax=Candidatus Yanofskybacteria bacterium RIFCSPLOWO2_01_FULL_44_22 TaxID=1802697 RepID=A0A1F8GK65_9BACT|nr:MAG: hypothetical protein A2659_03315 [Candidatus Yanofskybacteria bacterium RIFCSPHIGHO2_01_FULL_44_24]OGN14440.1 MAG: hypothetical protein A3B99_04510 [Candidatus Yanofskybacteria bacterium RIFCSPHIGHO2_02_FULL_44_12b]OGN25721.1 MAG: hypothetical protein A2925_00850 [Candidatus Yanofskybacteria bacterium RIFCSPLOWO2_01_FULL_44_22]
MTDRGSKVPNQRAFIIAGLGFGDETKGSITDFLTGKYEAHTIIRYNGGAQAAHNVVLEDGRHHTFAQFGSGTFHRWARTHLSQFMVVNPYTMIAEEKALRSLGVRDAFDRTTIDRRAVVVTPYHRIANRLLELSRGSGRYGSCGMGIGQAIQDYKDFGENILLVGDLFYPDRVRQKLQFIKSVKQALVGGIMDKLPGTEIVRENLDYLNDAPLINACVEFYGQFSRSVRIVNEEYIKKILNQAGTVIFEGAQGVLLDPKYGFRPYVTKTNTTFVNALEILEEGEYSGQVKKLGVLRGYATRHGCGPFTTEDAELTRLLPELHNAHGQWQGAFRIGYFDVCASRYAIEVAGPVDSLAISCTDRLIGLEPLNICTDYQSVGHKPLYTKLNPIRSEADCFEYARTLQSYLKIPLSIISLGPTAKDKQILKPLV